MVTRKKSATPALPDDASGEPQQARDAAAQCRDCPLWLGGLRDQRGQAFQVRAARQAANPQDKAREFDRFVADLELAKPFIKRRRPS